MLPSFSDPSPRLRTSALQLSLALILLAALLTFTAGKGMFWYWMEDLAFKQPWRYFSAHLAHLSALHLLLNALSALILAYSTDRLGLRPGLPAAAGLIVLAIDSGLEWGPWPLAWYAGASGLLHGVFAWICGSILRRRGHDLNPAVYGGALVLLAGGLAKVCIGLDIPSGSPGWIGIPQATPAHFYGYCGGLLAAVSLRPK